MPPTPTEGILEHHWVYFIISNSFWKIVLMKRTLLPPSTRVGGTSSPTTPSHSYRAPTFLYAWFIILIAITITVYGKIKVFNDQIQRIIENDDRMPSGTDVFNVLKFLQQTLLRYLALLLKYFYFILYIVVLYSWVPNGHPPIIIFLKRNHPWYPYSRPSTCFVWVCNSIEY